MLQVETWDYDNRRIHLSLDTVSAGVDFAAAYLEERAYREASGEDIRGKRPMMRGNGREPKGGGRFTPQFVTFLEGARPVPYNASHTLTLLTEPIADDGSVSGTGIIDRSTLSPGVEVNVEVGYQQVEIVTVPIGSGLTAEQANQLALILPMAKQLGLVSGISAQHSVTGILVSDGDGSTIITNNGDGTYTVAPAN